VTAAHLDVVNWNGQDSQQLVDNVVVKTGSQTIKGRKIFNGHLEIQNNLNVTGITCISYDFVLVLPINLFVK